MAFYDKIVDAVTEQTGLRGDGKTGVISGHYRGYTMIAEPVQLHSMPYTLKVSVCGPGGEWMDQKEANQKIKACTAIRNMERFGNTWVVNLKNKLSSGKQAEQICTAMQELTEFLRAENQQNVCARCGEQKTTQPAMINGTGLILCEDCFRQAQAEGTNRQKELEEKPERVIGGFIGALVGSLVGAAVIVLLGQLGYVAALSGVVMGVCVLKGYELLGGKLTKKGIVISILIMLLMVYVGTRLDWSIFLQREVYTEESIPSVFLYFSDAMAQLEEAGENITSSFLGELAMQYIFCVLGASLVVGTRIRQKKLENTASKI